MEDELTLGRKLDLRLRQRRWKIVLDAFRKNGSERLPWMAATSPNDGDVLIEITDKLREGVSVYSWYGTGNWFSISDSCVSQSVDGEFEYIDFGTGDLTHPVIGEHTLQYGDVRFEVPPPLVRIYADIIAEVEADASEIEAR